MTTQEEIVIPQTEFDPENSNFIEVPVGLHEAEIVNIEPAEAYKGDPDAKPQLKFTFKLIALQNKDGSSPEKWAWCNQVFNPASKLWKWHEQVTGAPAAPGQPFRTSSMLGAPCRVFVNKVKRDTAGGTQEFTKIVDVLGPLVEAAAPKVAAPKAPLAQRLAAVPDAPGPCFICEAEGTAYDAKGRPVCDDHIAV